MQYGGEFAKIYDVESASGGLTEFYLNALAAANKQRPIKEILDLGCGTGRFTRLLAGMGYKVTAADASAEMLSLAAARAAKEGLNITFINMRAEKLVLPHCTDCVTAVCDVFNYVKVKDLTAAFKRVYAALKPGGLFLFDVSSEEKLKALPVKHPVMAGGSDDYCYIWRNAAGKNSVIMDLTVFTKAENGLYARSEERHVQYIHSSAGLTEALMATGFSGIKAITGGSGETETGAADRLFFVCERPKPAVK